MHSYSTGSKLKKNILTGFASQLIIMLLGILVPRLVLVNYGSETNGLLSSVTQIYAYFELLEAGVGSATLQALFKWIGSEDGRPQVNRILSATAVYYNKVGILYAVCTAILTTVYPLALSSEINPLTIALIVLMQGIPGVCSYFVSSKFKLLLSADGRVYVQNNLSLFVRVLSNVAKIVLMLLGYNVLVVQFAFFVLNMLQIWLYKIYEKKKYSWVNYKSDPDFESISQKKNVFVHQISGLIFSNTDVLVLSFFCGLKVVSVYAMYTMVLSIVSTVINTISSSSYFYLGQTFNKDRAKYLRIHDINETYYMGFVFALFTITYILILPFLSLYTKGINDINYIDPILSVLFIGIKFLEIGRAPSLNVLNFSMKFKETQHQAIIEMVINIVVSLVGVYFLGIYGVLLGTIAALLYRGNVMIFYANKKVLGRSIMITYRRWIINISVFLLIAAFFHFYPLSISNYFSFFLYALPITIAVVAVYFGVISLFERKVCRDLFSILKARVFKRKTS